MSICFISDCHMSDRSRGDDFQQWELSCLALQDFLAQRGVSRVIFLGDTFDTAEANPEKIYKNYQTLLDRFHSMFNILYLEGNHDPLARIVSIAQHFVGPKFRSTSYGSIYVLNYQEHCLDLPVTVKYLFPICLLHGHIFDSQISRIPVLSGLVARAGGWLERHGYPRVDNWFSKFNNWVSGIGRHSKGDAFDRMAMGWADKNKFKTIICGHTHNAKSTENQGVRYLNPGAFSGTTVPRILLLDETGFNWVIVDPNNPKQPKVMPI